MAPPKGTAPRANQYMSFANAQSSSRATRRPSTQNLDSETNPLPPVSGQITYPTSAILPRDRGLGFETFENRRETPAPKLVEKSARRRRNMSAWRRPSDDEWATDDDVSITSDLMPDSASEGKPSPPRKKRKRDAKQDKPVQKSAADEDTSNELPVDILDPIPESLAEADDADRMMWAWRLQGKSWAAIHDEFLKLTGHDYKDATLSMRYAYMKRRFAANGCLDLPEWHYQKYPFDRYLKDLNLKRSNENQQYVKDCEVMMKANKELKKQRLEVAARIYKKEEGLDLTPADVEKRWANMRKMGRDIHPEEDYRPYRRSDRELPNQGGLALDRSETAWANSSKRQLGTADREVTDEELARADAMIKRAMLVSYPDSD
ncbi:hypothetical protein LTR96_004018 [Exophiala xenobiotica]|nr:hypothetical protein H2202_005247 [Exophiala xenobiotica]KAK5196393.1 hypothetical protein LTR92_003938 [Exophiala xenobiotica]KAK5227053.1 hypothetical protein LTR72_003043 [Exophiala xenobiotica]KAK5234554.1 hypothetical protein LTR47_004588 [Exophiala xenobiotica]KAK5254126.1 hypothetical protein LTS06_001613 [Exophiala xenobiotica]